MIIGPEEPCKWNSRFFRKNKVKVFGPNKLLLKLKVQKLL